MYEWKRRPDQPPVASPLGALGDIGSGLFAVIGLLAALRHRDRTGIGQHVDIAMFDSMVAMADVMTNYWSMGERPDPSKGLAMILDSFTASDGWFIVQCGREHEFARFADTIGHPEWPTDPRFATRAGWREHLEAVIRPAVDAWAADKSNVEVCHILSAAGVAAGPVFNAGQVIADPHVANRHMQVALPRTDGVADPVLIPGNPVKLSKTAEGPETRVPWLGEHTDAVLREELELGDEELAALRDAGVIS
jgi:formyl-CoA transferase